MAFFLCYVKSFIPSAIVGFDAIRVQKCDNYSEGKITNLAPEGLNRISSEWETCRQKTGTLHCLSVMFDKHR